MPPDYFRWLFPCQYIIFIDSILCCFCIIQDPFYAKGKGSAMISYASLPIQIRSSDGLNQLREKVPRWNSRVLFTAYMAVLSKGVKDSGISGLPSDIEARHSCLVQTAMYYVFRKELLKRMSPLVSARSRELILLDNKKLLDSFAQAILQEGSQDVLQEGSQDVLQEGSQALLQEGSQDGVADDVRDPGVEERFKAEIFSRLHKGERLIPC